MQAGEIDINYIAHLARISLTSEEQRSMTAQLARVLHYVEKLNELDIDAVEPTAHAFPLVNVFREDKIQPSLPHEEAMKNAPATANGLFLVPKIVE